MQLTFRGKLLILVLIGAFAFLQNILINYVLMRYSQGKLSEIENYYLPKLKLEDELKHDFGEMHDQFQNAVAANDTLILEDTIEFRSRFIEKTLSLQHLADSNQVKDLNRVFNEYFNLANDLARRMIQGETGEKIIQDATEMQVKQLQVNEMISNIFALNEEELKQVFRSVRTGQVRTATFSGFIGIVSLIILILLYLWINRDLIRSLTQLTEGLKRFGTGDLATPIAIQGTDDISQTSKVANEMALKLLEFNQKQQSSIRSSEGQSTLSKELQGELSPKEIVDRTFNFLGQFLQAQMGGIYYLHKQKLYKIDRENFLSQPKPINLGEGLIGQAALKRQIHSIKTLHHKSEILESGFGKLNLTEIIYCPLINLGNMIGIMELGFFTPSTDEDLYFLKEASEMVAVTLEVSIARENTRQLLEQTQVQSHQLQIQERELKQYNSQLEKQQQNLKNEKSKLEGLMRKLENSRKQVEIKAREAEQASAFKSQFLANMSHELRTPLNSIMVLAQLLSENKEENLQDQQIKNANAIYSAGRDLLGLINDILDLSKIEANKMGIIPQLSTLKDMAVELESIFEVQAIQKGLEFKVKIDAKAPKVIRTDPVRVNQILKNIISNALKFTETGHVWVKFMGVDNEKLMPQGLKTKPALCIQVEDTGIGIDKDKFNLIFESFQQADNSIDRKYSGTGLGLAISRSLARKLGGEIVVESNVGKGSRFNLFLPELPPDPELIHKIVTAPQKGLYQFSTPARSNSVVVIEDDDNFSNILTQKCIENNLDCQLFKDGESALEYIRQTTPRAIILDLILPGMDGISLLSHFRSHPQTLSIPVIVISVASREEEVKKLGANYFYQKPVSLQDLDHIMKFIGGEVDLPSPVNGHNSQTARGEFKGKKVLLAEDDVRSVFALRQVLLPTGIEILSAENGKEVLAFLEKTNDINLILMDIMMPEMDGLETIKYIRTNDQWKSVPIIALTAKAMPKDRDECLKVGANDYLTKPVDIEKLIQLLQYWLNQVELK